MRRSTCGGKHGYYWVQPGIATPPIRHSINQSEGKNAGVGSATQYGKFETHNCGEVERYDRGTIFEKVGWQRGV